MTRIVPFMLALLVAVIVATGLGNIAHHDLGITRGDIRTDALIGAGFIALGLVGEALVKRK